MKSGPEENSGLHIRKRVVKKEGNRGRGTVPIWIIKNTIKKQSKKPAAKSPCKITQTASKKKTGLIRLKGPVARRREENCRRAKIRNPGKAS